MILTQRQTPILRLTLPNSRVAIIIPCEWPRSQALFPRTRLSEHEQKRLGARPLIRSGYCIISVSDAAHYYTISYNGHYSALQLKKLMLQQSTYNQNSVVVCIMVVCFHVRLPPHKSSLPLPPPSLSPVLTSPFFPSSLPNWVSIVLWLPTALVTLYPLACLVEEAPSPSSTRYFLLPLYLPNCQRVQLSCWQN